MLISEQLCYYFSESSVSYNMLHKTSIGDCINFTLSKSILGVSRNTAQRKDLSEQIQWCFPVVAEFEGFGEWSIEAELDYGIL